MFRKRPVSNIKSGKLLGAFLLVPAVLFVLFTKIFPFMWNLVLSFFEWNSMSEMKWIFLKNYKHMLEDPFLLKSIYNTIYIGVASAVIGVLLGLSIAVFIYRMRKIEGAFYRTVFFIPHMLPLAVVGLLFVFILNPEMGLVNSFLRLIGLKNLQRAWLSESETVLATISITAGWRLTGLSMMLCYTAVNSLPVSLFESAEIDGAGYLRQVFFITLPIIKPTIQLTLLLSLINTFKAYDLVYIMTGGGPGYYSRIVPMHMLNVGYSYNEFGYAAAIAMLYTVMVALIITISKRITKGEVYEY